MRGQHSQIASEKRRAFGEALQALFLAHGITPDRYSEFGATVAETQIPKRDLPFHPVTIDGWLKGELLPNSFTFDALLTLLPAADEVQGVCQETFHAAKDTEVTASPSELSHALLYTVRTCGITQHDLVHASQEMNQRVKYRSFYIPDQPTAFSQMFHGNHGRSIPRHTTGLVTNLARRTGVEGLPNLLAIHEQTTRTRADIIWNHAVASGDFGGMLNACRVRIGEDQPGFYARIHRSAGLPFSNADKAPTVSGWEDNKTFPSSVVDGQRIPLCSALVNAMKIVDRAKNGLSCSHDFSDWFTPARETLLRQAFIKAQNKPAIKCAYTVREEVQEQPVCWTDKTLAVRDAQLSPTIINHRYRNLAMDR